MLSGVQEGATGMVVKVEGHVLIILSDTTKEDVSYDALSSDRQSSAHAVVW